jgi:fluoride exporter
VTGLWIALAGAGGALARFEVDGAIKVRWSTSFPWATFLINVSGSLLFGVLTGLVLFHGASGDLKLIAGTGFCGGYTTFSTASVETVRLVQRRNYWVAAFATLGTIALTLAAAALGLALTQL